MKKTFKRIMMYVMALMFCLVFADTAKAETIYYDMYILGEEVTSDNMSGEGWRFEPATEEDGYNKLYLTDANLVVDDSTITDDVDGQAIHMWDKLEIVLLGDNTINMNATNVSDINFYDALDAEFLVLSGDGSLTIKGEDYEAYDDTSSYYIYVDKILEIKEGVEINIEGMNISGGENVDIYSCGIISEGDMIINSGAEINISGMRVTNPLTSRIVGISGITAINLTIHENAKIKIEMNDVTGKEVEYIGIHSWEDLTIYDNVEIQVCLNSLTGNRFDKFGIKSDSATIGNNAKISVDMGSTNTKAEFSMDYAIYTFDSIKIGDNCKLNIKGSDVINETVTTEDFYTIGTSLLCNNVVIGDMTIIDTVSGKNGMISCILGSFEIGKDSIIKSYSDKIAMLCMTDNLTSYPKYGGDDTTQLKELKDAEVVIDGDTYLGVYNGETLAKYAEIGPLLTIDLKCDNGTVDQKSITAHNGHTIGTLPTPTRTGYTFTGWYTEPTGGSKVDSTTKLTKSTTLYAQWKKITYTISFNANGGSVGTSKKTVEYGSTLGTLPTPTRTGYTFTGWYTAASGGSKVYSTTKSTKSMTLYAQWKLNTYTIKFDGNGGTVGVEKKWVDYGNAMEFMPTPKRSGYTFTGWYTAKTGGTKVYSTTKVTKSMTLYAQWKIKTYTINFNGNGGTVGVAKKWVNHGNAMEFMPTPKRSGYTFTGWYTAKSGGTKVYSTTKPTKNMALYAQWKK